MCDPTTPDVATDFTIKVTYTPSTGDFQYTDEQNQCAESKRHLHANNTIKWLLYSPQGHTLQVQFGKDLKFSPFTSGDLTIPENKAEKVNRVHSKVHRYTVNIVRCSDNQTIDSDDPKIMFDDGTVSSSGVGQILMDVALLAGALGLGIFALTRMFGKRSVSREFPG
jgi:hypothetical protein